MIASRSDSIHARRAWIVDSVNLPKIAHAFIERKIAELAFQP